MGFAELDGWAKIVLSLLKLATEGDPIHCGGVLGLGVAGSDSQVLRAMSVMGERPLCCWRQNFLRMGESDFEARLFEKVHAGHKLGMISRAISAPEASRHVTCCC